MKYTFKQRLYDRIWGWMYRIFYCTRHGHRIKMDFRDHCLNCGKRLR